MSDDRPIQVEHFSDLLCIWAYVAQVRVDELVAQFGDRVRVEYRFCSVFGDTAHKVGTAWASRGGFQSYAAHVRAVATGFPHVEVHPETWVRVRPRSSTAPHLYVAAVRSLEARGALPVPAAGTAPSAELAWALRLAFFRDARDIGQREIQAAVAGGLGLPLGAIEAEIDSGAAHAHLAADERDRAERGVAGSPTYVLNEGRQRLYGNIGYRVIEANIRELLREPAAGQASWC